MAGTARLGLGAVDGAVEIGDRAPDFTLQDSSGAPVTLTHLLRTGPVVVFFYPAALTLGCTAEACHFRDTGPAFVAAGARRVGISADPVGLQSEFVRRNRLDFPVLSDPEGAVARAYGARRRLRDGATKRATFVIGTDGVVRGIITNQLQMKAHADKALELLGR